MESENKALRAAALAEEKKATDIAVLHVGKLCSFTDYFVICSGQSSLQLKAIADSVEVGLKEEGSVPLAVDGRGLASWVVLDYGDVIVHIMSEEARSYYALEHLWGDARTLTPIQNTGRPRSPTS